MSNDEKDQPNQIWCADHLRNEESCDLNPAYKVMIRCEQYCENWEDTRELHRTSDPVEAIDRATLMRDQLHVAWVERVDPSKDERSEQRKTAEKFVRVIHIPVAEKPYVELYVEEGIRLGPYKSMDDLQKVEYPDLLNMKVEGGYPA